FGPDDRAGTWPVLGDERHAVIATDLFGKNAGEDVGGAACRQRYDDLDPAPDLGARLTGGRDRDERKARDDEGKRGTTRGRGAEEFHGVLADCGQIGGVVGL